MTSVAGLLDEAERLYRDGRLAAAEETWRAVLQVEPENIRAWCNLGVAHRGNGRLNEAVACYRQALRLQPDLPEGWNNLGNTFVLLCQPEEALASYDRALRLRPDYAGAHRNRSLALTGLGRPAEALAAVRRAVALAPADIQFHLDLGMLMLASGDFEEGWREYAWRLQPGGPAPRLDAPPLWDGAPLDGQTILLVAEQGLGDVIHFIRYASVLKQAYRCRVLLACPEPLHALLAHCPGIDGLVAAAHPPPAADVYCPLLHVPALLGERLQRTPGPMPYLFAEPERERRWRDRLGPAGGLRVGLVWQGNPAHPLDRLRSFPLETLAPLRRLAGLRLFSLQQGAGTGQLDRWAGGLTIVSLAGELDRGSEAFLDTAAVLNNLDLLIAADTAVAHLAGALGVRTWLALSAAPDWRWGLGRKDTPWYPSLRLFRQRTMGDWTDVFERMAEALAGGMPGVGWRSAGDFRVAECGMCRLAHTRPGLMLLPRHDRYIGRALELYGEYSPGEAELFRRLVRPGQVVVEAGANVGAHTLALSALVGDDGRVVAFEMQRVLYQVLCANLALNGRTNVHGHLAVAGAAPGWTRVPRLDYHREGNFGGIAPGGPGDGERVPVVTIDSLDLTTCHLIKADVEGTELDVLRGADATIRRHRPLLYVENDRPERSTPLIAHLRDLGYDLYGHRPPLFDPGNFYRNAENVFPGLVSNNILGVPRDFPRSLPLLVPPLLPFSIQR